MTDEITKKICWGFFCEGKILPVTSFRYVKKPKTILSKYCTDCMKIQHKINHENRKLKKFEYESHQICNTCSKNLPIEKFAKRCKDSGEREKQCKNCRNAARDPEQRKKAYEAWLYEKGGLEIKKQIQEKYKAKRNTDNAARQLNDPKYKLINNIKHGIWEALRKNGTSRSKKIKYLGLGDDPKKAIEIYWIWLQFQFSDAMTKENYGKVWQLHYVKPCDSYNIIVDDETAIYECFNWKNTRPLFVKNNLSKGLIDHNAMIKQTIQVQLFITTYPQFGLEIPPHMNFYRKHY